MLVNADIVLYDYERSSNSPGRYQLDINNQVCLVEDYYDLPAGLLGYVNERKNQMDYSLKIDFPIHCAPSMQKVSNKLFTVTTKGIPLFAPKVYSVDSNSQGN